MQQLSFDFLLPQNYPSEDFIVSEANRAAFNFIINYHFDDNKYPKIFAICGEEFCGKTYLAHLWQQKFNANFLDIKKLENANLLTEIHQKKAYIVEDIDKIIDQQILLQIFNLVLEKNAYLLLTSSKDLAQINYNFKDLASRLKNVFSLEIKQPDDDLIKMLLIKNFSEKQLLVDRLVIDFLAKNIKRDFVTIFKITKLLEFYSLEKKRNITIALAKEICQGDNSVA